MHYDVIVLGAGPGGYLAAERAGHAGLKTMVIEKKNIGGVCLNEGCVPSKTLLNSAKIYEYTKDGQKYGVTCENVSYDQEKVVKRKDKVVKALVNGVQATLKKNKVEIVSAEGSIIGKTSQGFVIRANNEEHSCTNLIIATGSEAIVPPIPGVKESFEKGIVVTNREILSLKSVPKKLTVVGGGVIGLEMASYYATVGSKVTVIEMLDRIGGYTDKEIGTILKGNLEKKGINFLLGTKVTKVQDSVVYYEVDGKESSVESDKILLSIGRRANTTNIGLEKLSLATERGAIKVDEICQTNVPGVYAVGDVNGKSMLAHTAYREAEVAVNTILGKKDIMRYTAIPSVIYTNPEVASVGETEETAKRKGLDYEVKKISMNYSGRYMAENEGGNGITKILIDKKYNKIIGIQMIGSYASEIIYGGGMMVETEMLVKDLKEIVFPHPTVSEIIREAIFQ
ncbi:dihydrolipoyl dehydrogenase [Alkalibaculum bacchi]|uniref:dihydrolipoyl dehydrogenase n=1 Tax=Alkalibaculum bacchi TaxID=645887 RepID=UPI0026F286D0|nr:dihydrolipoyl dehydrogenase [Alkalibaculum bacchi]